jgi:hypothetical protein
MLTAITSKIRTKEGRVWDGSAHRKKDLSHIAPPVVRVVIAKHLTDGSQIVVREHDCFRQTGRAAGKNHCRTSFAGILSVQDICFGWDSVVGCQEIIRELEKVQQISSDDRTE